MNFVDELKNSRRGFTLLELLLVVTIIIILASILMITINPVEMSRRGRDAARFQDLENIEKAIGILTAQQAVSIPVHQGSTLNPAQTRDCGDAVSNWLGMDVCTYLPTLPNDPRHSDGAPWAYEFASDGEHYELRCKVESPRNYERAENDGGSQNICPNAGCWYERGTDLDLL